MYMIFQCKWHGLALEAQASLCVTFPPTGAYHQLSKIAFLINNICNTIRFSGYLHCVLNLLYKVLFYFGLSKNSAFFTWAEKAFPGMECADFKT